MKKIGSLVIDPRFCGPPDSGNGGYVAGRLAESFGAGGARVRLRLPPPLERELEIVEREVDGERVVELRDDGTRVAEARAGGLQVELPAAPDAATARAASERYRGFRDHFFPRCFVCGPERATGDGLRIFVGPVEADGGSGDLHAAPWTPDASLDDGQGHVRPEFLWAALDCPSGMCLEMPPDRAILLGEMTAVIDREVRVGEPCVLAAWEISNEGRKHYTASALYDGTGAVCARSQATWIEVPRSDG